MFRSRACKYSLEHRLTRRNAGDDTGMALYGSDAQQHLIQSALMQPPESRTPQQIGALQRLTSTIGIFSAMQPDAHAQLCKRMTFRSARKSAAVIFEGDSADCM